MGTGKWGPTAILDFRVSAFQFPASIFQFLAWPATQMGMRTSYM